MISNERPSPYCNKAYTDSKVQQFKAGLSEQTLKVEKIRVEHKKFTFMLKENVRGRFVRIVEIVGHRRNSVVVPTVGIDEFKRVLELMVKSPKV